MDTYPKKEEEKALQTISSVIAACEKMRFKRGSSQNTLLNNRIKALRISCTLLKGENVFDSYTREDLAGALRPLDSIIGKCEKALSKPSPNSSGYTRLKNIVEATRVSKSLIERTLKE
jgi:hypothetical protein